jgi:S1-C subfamily serine protease
MPLVHCPTCRQALTVADGLGGAVVTCPTCQKPMTLPPMPVAAAPAVVAQLDFIESFAVPASEPRRERDRDPGPTRERKTDWTPVALVGAAGFLGLIGVGVVVWMVAGGSKPAPSGKDKAPEVVKGDRTPPQPKVKAEPLAVTGGRMDDATVARIKKATVYIRITGVKTISSGSGFFVDKGLVVTNHHVINHPGKLEVVVQSGTPQAQTFPARVVGQDAGKDLAILEVDGAAAADTLKVADTTTLRETHEVYAFGFPLGERLGQEITVTKTTVSSIRSGADRRRQEVQLNGGLERGNSGGPVTDAAGRVVGVAVSGIAGTNINFAIAAEEVQQFLSRFHER